MSVNIGRVAPAVLIVTILMSPLLVGPASSHRISIVKPLSQGSEGPVFVDVEGIIVDTTIRTEPTPFVFVLHLWVLVWDPNGIDTALGSYKDNSDSIWTNVTMTYVDTETINDSQYSPVYYYQVNATTFSLDPNHSGKVWNVKFYARDTIGIWAVSRTVNYSYCAWYDLRNSTSTSTSEGMPVNLLAGGVLAGAVVLVLSVAYLRRRL